MSNEISRRGPVTVGKAEDVSGDLDTGGMSSAGAQDTVDEEQGQYGQTQRGLKSRHIQLIALGGCIGAGLFVGTGSTLSLVGPAPLFLSFMIMSALVWIVTQSLTEITTYLPVQGASVLFYINRYLCPSLAFAAGWNYWYSYAMAVAAEISAARVVIEYWSNPVPIAVWRSILLTILALNIFIVSLYGESEFWFASVKILAILGLIILGIVLFFGGGPNNDLLGFRYWQHPGAFTSYPNPGLGTTGKVLAFWTSLIRSGFAEAPRRNIPEASRRFIYRLVVFYIRGTLVISVIVSSDDPELLQAVSKGAQDAGASPFVLGIKRAGIKGLDHVINAVILTSAWSGANSFLYAGSRSLYSLAMTGQAPRVLKTCSKSGVPYVALLCTAAVSCLTYLSVSSGSATVFAWLLMLPTVSGCIAWIVLFLAYIRFRKVIEMNGLLSTLPYTSRGQPYTAYVAMSIVILLCFTNGFQVFFPGNFSAGSFMAAYITLPLFLVLYLGHKSWHRTAWAIPLSQVDVWSGKEQADALEGEDVVPVARNWMQRIWFWLV